MFVFLWELEQVFRHSAFPPLSAPLGTTKMVFAYLDPGSGSLLLQALVGGSAGVMVLARYVWQTYVTRQSNNN